MVKKYYIMRHGETFATKLKKHYGLKVFSATILEEGKPTLAKMGKYLKDIPTDYQVRSEILRCRETAEIITKESGKEFIADSRLNEYFIETFGYFRKRIQSFLNEVNSKPYKNILIITHGAVIAGLVNLITTGTFEKHQKIDFPNPGVLLIVEGKTLQRIDFNAIMNK